MRATQRDSHAPDSNGKRVLAAKHTAMSDADLGPFIEAERAQALAVFMWDVIPNDRSDPGGFPAWQMVQSHCEPRCQSAALIASDSQLELKFLARWIAQTPKKTRDIEALAIRAQQLCLHLFELHHAFDPAFEKGAGLLFAFAFIIHENSKRRGID